ncbi:MAG: family transcriptional regulator [Gammaproteobacteria bacterium]|jgi:addiction module HigA family antidote|nr:family transcriptional regulator [Gammaproteobacteria bacterium]
MKKTAKKQNTLRSKKLKPTHPGAILREDVLPELNMTQGDIAKALGVSRRTVSQILKEHRPITLDMAKRLERFLGTSAESWLKMQNALDLWVLEQDNQRAREYRHIPQAARMAA